MAPDAAGPFNSKIKDDKNNDRHFCGYSDKLSSAISTNTEDYWIN